MSMLSFIQAHAGNTNRAKKLHTPDIALGVGVAEDYTPKDSIIKYVMPRYKTVHVKNSDDRKFEVKYPQVSPEQFPSLDYEGEDIYDYTY